MTAQSTPELSPEQIARQIAILEGHSSHILIDNDMPALFTRAELLAVYQLALRTLKAEADLSRKQEVLKELVSVSDFLQAIEEGEYDAGEIDSALHEYERRSVSAFAAARAEIEEGK